MVKLPKMVSYFNYQMMISILAPESWTGTIVNESQFRIFGPQEPNFKNYRSTMSYLKNTAQAEGIDFLELLVSYSDEELKDNCSEFRLIREKRFTLSSFAPTYVRWYEWWDKELNLQFVQLQALILDNSVYYVVNSATLKPLQETYIPIFEHILQSTRIIPAKLIVDM